MGSYSNARSDPPNDATSSVPESHTNELLVGLAGGIVRDPCRAEYPFGDSHELTCQVLVELHSLGCEQFSYGLVFVAVLEALTELVREYNAANADLPRYESPEILAGELFRAVGFVVQDLQVVLDTGETGSMPGLDEVAEKARQAVWAIGGNTCSRDSVPDVANVARSAA